MNKNYQNRVMQASKRGVVAALAWIVASAATASSSSPEQAISHLTPYEAVYTAYKWGDDVGEATLKLESLSNGQYSLAYSSKVSKFFLSDKRHEHSIFKIDEGALVPIEYHYTRTGTGPDKSLDVTFNKDQEGKIKVKKGDTFDYNGEFDNQIYRIDLANKLANGETQFDYSFINYRGELRSYGVEVIKREPLDLPFGQLDAVKVKLIRDSNKRETFAWFAPTLDFALVRLQQFKDGEEQGDIKLKSFDTLD